MLEENFENYGLTKLGVSQDIPVNYFVWGDLFKIKFNGIPRYIKDSSGSKDNKERCPLQLVI